MTRDEQAIAYATDYATLCLDKDIDKLMSERGCSEDDAYNMCLAFSMITAEAILRGKLQYDPSVKAISGIGDDTIAMVARIGNELADEMEARERRFDGTLN